MWLIVYKLKAYFSYFSDVNINDFQTIIDKTFPHKCIDVLAFLLKVDGGPNETLKQWKSIFKQLAFLSFLNFCEFQTCEKSAL